MKSEVNTNRDLLYILYGFLSRFHFSASKTHEMGDRRLSMSLKGELQIGQHRSSDLD